MHPYGLHTVPFRLYYNWKKADWKLISDLIRVVPWNLFGPLYPYWQAFDLFYDLLISVTVPKGLEMVTKYSKWFNHELMYVVIAKERAHRRYKRSGSHSDYLEFISLRKRFKTLQGLNKIRTRPWFLWMYLNSWSWFSKPWKSLNQDLSKNFIFSFCC